MNKRITYDVIIIGAGPAGLTAAKILADNNKKVLILEKDTVVGNKVCAGGLTLKDFEELHLPKFLLVEKEFKYINLYIAGRLIKLDLGRPWIWTCSRKELGKRQRTEAKRAGAAIYLGKKVVRIQKEFVLTNDRRKFFFKYLIGADGSNSIVRKFLGLKTRKILIAIQYLVPQEKFSKNELEIFFDLKKFGPSYIWIFPHKKYNSVGVCADSKFIRAEKLKRNFDNWCREINLNPSTYKFQAAPINYDFQGVEFGNIFLIGDAAGLASGLTGEGMHPAMISGREVARKIVNPNYDFKELKNLIKTKKFEERVLTFYKTNKAITEAMFNLGVLLLRIKVVQRRLIKFLTEE